MFITSIFEIFRFELMASMFEFLKEYLSVSFQATLCRTSSIESKIRQATKEALRELKVSGVPCICRPPAVVNGCRICLRREICHRLLNVGYNCGICKSKWRSSSEIPSGNQLRVFGFGV